nr:IscS subfamily cysteine desulfurase [Fictibacillus phosphorivorans]
MIYLDYAATTPMSEKAIEAFIHTSRNYYQNTESLHDGGLYAKELLEHARTALAKLMEKDPNGIFFTGGGSDGNFLAITSLAFGTKQKGKHIITSNVEHPSVDYALHFLEQQGFVVTRIPVDSSGTINIAHLKENIRPDTILATIQHVNSETGIKQDLKAISAFLKKKEILFHSDCVQSFLKVDDFKLIDLDSFTVSAHKIHGPKGTGAVYISPSIHLSPLLKGVTHERGFRPGTVDLPSIVSFATAAEEYVNKQSSHYAQVQGMRKLFLSLILKNEEIIFEGSPDSSPYILPFRVRGMEGQIIMQELSRRKIAVSTGSACKNGLQSPSKTLLALGRTESEAHGLVRVSLSHLTTSSEIHTICNVLKDITDQFITVREVAFK